MLSSEGYDMTKQEIRKRNLKLRAQIKNREELDEKIHKLFLESLFYKNAKTIMIYVSYKSEIDTKRLIVKMQKDTKRLCAPVCYENGEMEAYEFSDIYDLKENNMGILEPECEKKVLPEQIDLIIVPGCAFNESGARVGYGGGFYDRFLTKTTAKACGLFYEALKTDFTPDKTDVPLSMVITEEKIYKF